MADSTQLLAKWDVLNARITALTRETSIASDAFTNAESKALDGSTSALQVVDVADQILAKLAAEENYDDEWDMLSAYWSLLSSAADYFPVNHNAVAFTLASEEMLAASIYVSADSAVLANAIENETHATAVSSAGDQVELKGQEVHVAAMQATDAIVNTAIPGYEAAAVAREAFIDAGDNVTKTTEMETLRDEAQVSHNGFQQAATALSNAINLAE